MAVNKIDPKVIFASEAPAQDTPAVFTNRTVGWGETRKNGGRPTIKQMNAEQQSTDLKILWLNENSVTPYDPTIDYPLDAVTIKDGVFKIFNGSVWDLFLDKSDVGLSDVDNTSDLNKPVSTATQTALDLKADKVFIDNTLLLQQEINDRGGATWYTKSGGYALNARVILDNGDIVRSTVANNIINPNVDMTGWVKTNAASQIFDESGKSQQEINDQRAVNVKDYFAKAQLADCLTTTPSLRYSDSFQAAVNAAIANGSHSIFIPFDRGERYVLDKTVNIPASGFAILGNRAPSYHIHLRGGRITADAGVTEFFNYGVGGTYDSNQFVVDGVAALGLGDAPRTQNFVKMDQDNDGPHRGVHFKNVSARGLNDVLYITATTESHLGAASVVFDNSCCFISNQNTCNADRRVFNFRMAGIQSEAGARINGKFDGGVTIVDNMLEGQSDPITIDANSTSLYMQNNYIEAATGNYVVSFKGTNVDAIFDERPNYLSRIQSTDIFKLTGFARLNAPYRYYLRDGQYSLYSFIGLNLALKSKFDGRAYVGTTAISTDGVRGFCLPESLLPPRTSAVTNHVLGTDSFNTPFGKVFTGINVTGTSPTLTVAKTFTTGDVITAVALVKLTAGEAPTITLRDNSANLISSLGQNTVVRSTDGWAIVLLSGAVATSGTAIRFTFQSTLGISVAAIGVDVTPQADFVTKNGVSRAEIQVFNPLYSKNSAVDYVDTRTITIPLISNNQTYTTTVISVNGAAIGDALVCTPNVDMQGLYWFPRVSAANTIELRIVNPTTSSVTLGAVQWNTRVFK